MTQTLPQKRQVSWTQAISSSLRLMPVGVDQWWGAHFVQALALLLREPQFSGLEVVCELLIGTRPEYDRGHARSARQPREGYRRRGHATILRDIDEHVHDVVELIGVAHRRLVPAFQVPSLRGFFVTPVLAREQTR